MGWGSVASRVRNTAWELALGVSTRGESTLGTGPDSSPYATASYRETFAVLDELDLGADDVLLDVGSGKGRVLVCASLRRMKLVRGVDHAQGHVEAGRANTARVRRRRSPVEIVCGDALELDYDDVTALYLFNPFGRATLDRLVQRIDGSLDDVPRQLRVAYVHPEHLEAFEASRHLLHERTVGPTNDRRYEHVVAYLSTAPRRPMA